MTFLTNRAPAASQLALEWKCRNVVWIIKLKTMIWVWIFSERLSFITPRFPQLRDIPEGWSITKDAPHKLSVSIPGFVSHRSFKKPQVVASTEWIHPQQQILGCGSSPGHPSPTSAPLPAGANLQFWQNPDISVPPFWFFLSLEAGSVFPTQIKPRSDKFSRLSRCLPQISCPPFTSSPWPSIPSVHRLGGSSFPFLLTPFKSFPLDSHNSEITGTRCCFLVFPFNFQITSKLWPCLPRFCLKRGFIAVLSTAE